MTESVVPQGRRVPGTETRRWEKTMVYRRKAATRRARQAGIVFVGFFIAVTAIAVAAVVGGSEPAYACFPYVACW